MSIGNETKINKLLKDWPSGAVFLSSWLSNNGISSQLLNRYKKGQWLTSLGTGAVIRAGDKVDYHGALYALQKQAGLSVHAGGRTALSLLGKAHYLEIAAATVVLFGHEKEKLPAWFKTHDWTIKLDYYATSFLPCDLGLVDLEFNNFSLKISSPTRAMMECLYLVPKNQELMECYELMEGLNNLRPQSVQELLEQCTSIKVKRLFMYLAEKVDHSWVKHLNMKKIKMGTGKRSLAKGGVYIDKYKITVPKELEKNEKPNL
ncbi:hypothetical protein MNBD_GAMMA12-2192 [hydrothermal vent metagenome]|uniref:Transcriptional regulator AbiEi antitoxin N-terminal domain-containing protein n=1 Tax=hydrothermal vent metagenome TaxID=652676 RepID=A0A3B0YB69_9ZZZZ